MAALPSEDSLFAERPSCHFYMLNIHVHTLTLALSLMISVGSAGMFVADARDEGIMSMHTYLYGLTALAFGMLLYGRIAKLPIFYVPVLYVWRFGALICIVYMAYYTRKFVIALEKYGEKMERNVYLLGQIVDNTYMIVYCGVIIFIVNIMSRDYDYTREVLKRPFVTIRGVGVEPRNLFNTIFSRNQSK